MVPSKAEFRNDERAKNRKESIVVTESDENQTTAFEEKKETNGYLDEINSNGAQAATNGITNGTNGTHTPPNSR